MKELKVFMPNNSIERPLDMLNMSRGKEVIVQLKNDRQFVGTLRAFDIHINVVLDNTKEMHNGQQGQELGFGVPARRYYYLYLAFSRCLVAVICIMTLFLEIFALNFVCLPPPLKFARINFAGHIAFSG